MAGTNGDLAERFIVEQMELYVLLLALAAFVAGVIDTIAGGGGLITFPSLLLAGLSPIPALGTAKLQGTVCGFASVLHFKRGGHVDYKLIYPYLAYICVGALAGSIAIQSISVDHLKKIIPFMLLGVFIYFILPIRKQQQEHHPRDLKKLRFFGPVISFYDGFFGPGTGSIWTVVLTRFVNLNIRPAIMHTKLLNLTSTSTALVVFLFNGSVYIVPALFMGTGAYLGGIVGARFVIYRDSTVVKGIFTVLMLIATLSTFYKYYFCRC